MIDGGGWVAKVNDEGREAEMGYRSSAALSDCG